MRTRLSGTRLLTIGCVCLLLHSALGNLDPRDPVADVLAGSLEYSWIGAEGDDTQLYLQAQKHQQHRRQQQMWMKQLAPLEALKSAFDRAGGRRRRFKTSSTESKTNNNYSDTSKNCEKPRFVAEETWESILLEMGRVLQANNLLLPTLLPLSKVLTEPLEEEDKSEMPRLMRLIEIGLVAFHHVAGAIPEGTKAQLDTILFGTKMLQRQLVELFKCQDRNWTPELAAKAVSWRSCAAAGIFYEDYFEQLRRVMENAGSGFKENQLVKEAFSKLKFQSEGVYLTQQGARKAVDAVEKEDSIDEWVEMVALMRLTLAAGDALQGCQISLQRSIVKAQAKAGSVSDLEQVIYGLLAMGGRRRDPISSPMGGGGGSKEGVVARCHAVFTEAVDMVDFILSIPVVEGGDNKPTGSVFLHRLLTKYVDRIGEWIQKAWKAIDQHSASDGGSSRGGGEWRQIEMVGALLVKNLKDVEFSELSERTESVVYEFLGPARRLEGKIRELGACILSVDRQHGPSKTEAEAEAGEGGGHKDEVAKRTQLPCGFLAERGRETIALAIGGVALARLTGSGEELEEALEKVAKAVGLWDEAHGSVVMTIVADEWKNMKATAVVGTTAALDGLERAYEGQVIGDGLDVELTELVPLVVTQIRALQACSNVQRATSPSSPSSSSSSSA
ncbi:hypothetical protein K457DRAFT_25071 [Linnemannia elongata AG-77]|uniref:Uncharacterized protein n=1 Tax=Linnemannia elongata AG-77 TaxID=1314771 RepID=A0A197JEH9_9FUNG|nr:hypothetical protein K457DRAFT_25071 [Linnemannia elongata AG-77]